MAFTTPAALVITKGTQFVTPLADEDPLGTALENCNHLYPHYIPPLVDVVWMASQGLTRTSAYEHPILPSADDLRYNFRTLVRTGAGTGTLTITIEEWVSGAWNTIDSTAGIAAAAASVIQHDVTSAVIQAGATKLRFTYARASANAYYPESALVWPAPASPVSAGVMPSGFVPYDTGLLSAAGAPITTEHVNRCKRSSLAVLIDRYQAAMSLVQEDNQAGGAPRIVAGAATMAQPAGSWNRIGRAVWPCPGQRDPTIELRVTAQIDAGTTVSDLVRVSQLGGQSTDFDADLPAVTNLTVQTGTLELKTDGTASAHAVLEVWVKYTTGVNTTVHSAVGFWRPGD